MAALGIAILRNKTQQTATRVADTGEERKLADLDGTGLDPGFIEGPVDIACQSIAMAG